MWVSLKHTSGRIMLLVVAVALAVGAGLPGARLVVAGHRAAQACAAIGTYTVGGTQTGAGTIHPQPGAATKPGPKVVAPAIAYPIYGYGQLTGQLTLAGYTGCGGLTQGSFEVHSTPYRGPLPMQPAAGNSGNAIPVLPIYLNTGVLTATGTIAQDPTHAGDPTYLAVTATVIYGSRGFSCPPTCGANPGPGAQACPATGCTAQTVVTRTAAVASVTGYLRVQMGQRIVAGLTFLPPPDPAQSSAAAAMTVQPVAFTGVRTGP